MADGITLKVQVGDFQKSLKALGADIGGKIVRAGVSAGAVIFKKKAISFAPIYSGKPRKGRVAGTLRKAIYIKRLRASRGNEHYVVAVRLGNKGKAKGNTAYYGNIVQMTHAARGPGGKIKGGRRTRALLRSRSKQVLGNPFLAKAFSAGKEEAVQAFNSRIEKRIEKANRER